MLKSYFLSIVLIVSAFVIQAQTDTLENEEVEVIKEYTPYLADGKKQRFTPMMPNVEAADRGNLNYDTPAQFIQTRYEPDEIRPMPINYQDLQSESTIYAKAGYGNASNPLAQIAISSAQQNDYSIGILGDYQALTGDLFDDQKMADLNIDFFATKELNQASIDGGISYNQRKDWLYGYDHETFNRSDDEVEQAYNTIGANFGVGSVNKDEYAFQYRVNGKADFLNSQLYDDNKESQFGLGLELQQQIFADLDLSVLASAGFRNTTIQDESMNENLFNVTPVFQPNLGNIELELGASVNYDKANEFEIFPEVSAEIPFSDNDYIFFAGWKGKTVMNGLQQTIQINPRISESSRPENYTKQVITPAGIKGSFSENFSFHSSVSREQINNAPFYSRAIEVTDTPIPGVRIETSKFDILLEEQLVDWTPNITLNYQLGEMVNAVADVNYHIYDTETYSEAIHLPTLDAGLNLSFSPIRALDIQAGFNALSGIQEVDENGDIAELDGIFNANIGAEYMITENFGAFINANNLANQEFERWKNYPSTGFNILGGIVFSY